MKKAWLIDAVKNQTIAVKIYLKSTSANVKNLLKKYTPENKRFEITTDHKTSYNKPIKELNISKSSKMYISYGQIVSKKVDDGMKGKTFSKNEIYVIIIMLLK